MKASYEAETGKYITNTNYTVNKVRTEKACPEHTHEYVEIVYTFHGRARHTVDGRVYTVGRGDLIFVNYGSVHSVEPMGVVAYVDIMLKPEFLDEGLEGTRDAFSLLSSKDFKDFSGSVEQERQLVHFQGDDRKQIESLIEMTLAEQSDERSGTELMKRSALNILLGLIFRNMNEERGAQMRIDVELLSYIEKNCHERLTVENLAKQCCYSEEHFSRSFKKYTGKNFTEYINRCRINKAAELLVKTEMAVEDIFLECGFSNRTGFFKSFLKETGYTPLQYRKISKKGTFESQ